MRIIALLFVTASGVQQRSAKCAKAVKGEKNAIQYLREISVDCTDVTPWIRMVTYSKFRALDALRRECSQVELEDA